jgi:hypothetical protein
VTGPLFSQNGVPSIDGMQKYIRPRCCNGVAVMTRIGEIRQMMDADQSLAETDRELAEVMLQFFEHFRNLWNWLFLMVFGPIPFMVGLIMFGINELIPGCILFVLGIISTVIGAVKLCQATRARMACLIVEQARARDVQNTQGQGAAGMAIPPPGMAVPPPGVAGGQSNDFQSPYPQYQS